MGCVGLSQKFRNHLLNFVLAKVTTVVTFENPSLSLYMDFAFFLLQLNIPCVDLGFVLILRASNREVCWPTVLLEK
jgi:hypothetical protein